MLYKVIREKLVIGQQFNKNLTTFATVKITNLKVWSFKFKNFSKNDKNKFFNYNELIK
mgnify:CR=1 FL=1